MAVIHSDPFLRNLSAAEALHDLLASRLHKYLTRKHDSIHVKMMLWRLSRRTEFRVSQRSESVLLSRHLGEHDVRTLPAASGAQIYHGVAFLVPHSLPQATKCACFYLLHELALWLAAGTLPFGTHVLTEDGGVWTTWSLRSPPPPSSIPWPNYVCLYHTTAASVWFRNISEPGVVVRGLQIQVWSLTGHVRLSWQLYWRIYDGK